MSKKTSLKPIAAALGTTFVVSLATSPLVKASENPFSMTELSNGGYMVADTEGKCGEGKCGEESGEDKGTEGKCGEGKCGESGSEEEKDTEGKCGEGKCGESSSDEDKDTEGKCGEGKCGEQG